MSGIVAASVRRTSDTEARTLEDMYRHLTDLARVLRDAGVDVVELDGWPDRGRPSYTGEFAPKGILWHHTGGASDGRRYAEWMTLTGRTDLPAPLCQLSVDRTGTWYVGAAGRANHAGEAKASGPMPAGDGNALYLGVECHNTGTEGWTEAQRDSMVTGGAALTKYLRATAEHNRAHRETSMTGKWDPGALDMDVFRADITAAMNPKPDLTRGPLVDPLVKGTRKAKRAARSARRKAALKTALAALRSLPQWPRRDT